MRRNTEPRKPDDPSAESEESSLRQEHSERESASVSRRDVLGSVAAGAALGPFAAGQAAAQGPGDGNGPPKEHNVGTSTQAATEEAKRRAKPLKRVLDFETRGKAVTGRYLKKDIEALEKHDGVRYIERNGRMEATAQTLPWGIDRVDAEVAHANGYTGGENDQGDRSGVDIAIIDTGIDSDHPDLQANIGRGAAFIDCDPLSSRNSSCTVGSDPNDNPCDRVWDDDADHGTHVAGTADAVDDTSHVVGVSTGATLHAVKVLDECGGGTFSSVAAGIRWVGEQQFDVANMSLGGGHSDVVEDAVEYAYNRGVLLVAAAGNRGPCSDCVGHPAAEPEVIAVSATDDTDSLASFSSTGPEVELAAPGDTILSTVAPESDADGLAFFSGTSMASPHVAGTGAQLMDNRLTNVEARRRLRETAEDIGLSSNEQGSGLVDTAAALGLSSTDDL